MNEDFNRNLRSPSDFLYFLNWNLPCQHDSVCSQLFKQQSPLQIVNSHLGGAVNLHICKIAGNIVKNCQILHYDAVHTYFIQLAKLPLHIFDFILKHDGVHGYIYFNISEVGIPDRFLKRFNVEIV